MKQRIGVLGSGGVGKILSEGFQKKGHSVTLGTEHPEKLSEWAQQNKQIAIGNFSKTISSSDSIILAVKGTAAEAVVKKFSSELAGRVVIDATNPIADKPPVNGVIQFFTSLDKSLMEILQAAAPQAKFVKAFNSVGNALMIDPDFGDGHPTMFICGNDPTAKKEVSELLQTVGWDAEDMGHVESARAIEPLCMLWCIPGMIRNQWSHAFKLLKQKTVVKV